MFFLPYHTGIKRSRIFFCGAWHRAGSHRRWRGVVVRERYSSRGRAPRPRAAAIFLYVYMSHSVRGIKINGLFIKPNSESLI